MAKEQQIASIMSQLAKDIVWPFVQQLAHQYHHTVHFPFESQVGQGRKTYHQCKIMSKTTPNVKKGRRAHCVIFGQKMIESKFNQIEAERWLSGREIKGKKFYDGVIRMDTLLAHTILHEMAHVIQTIAGDRIYKSVHNKAFYQWLWHLHSLCGQQVLDSLNEKAQRHNIDLSFSKTDSGHDCILETKDIRYDMLYHCTLRKQQALVSPIRINRKTITVRVIQSHSLNNTEWKVSPIILQPARQIQPEDENSNNEHQLSSVDIKLFKKYKTTIKRTPVVVEVKKKNQKTVNAVVVDKASRFYGQMWRIPIQVLELL